VANQSSPQFLPICAPPTCSFPLRPAAAAG
jgi:hypothetical protein